VPSLALSFRSRSCFPEIFIESWICPRRFVTTVSHVGVSLKSKDVHIAAYQQLLKSVSRSILTCRLILLFAATRCACWPLSGVESGAHVKSQVERLCGCHQWNRVSSDSAVMPRMPIYTCRPGGRTLPGWNEYREPIYSTKLLSAQRLVQLRPPQDRCHVRYQASRKSSFILYRNQMH
jgi:hypothetical protein